MVGTKIQAVERPVGQIFTDEFQFVIPRYQRPYAWNSEQAAEMLQDLLSAAEPGPSIEESDPYFLGSIVLVKGETQAEAEVVDGQQRLTTLTVLLSVLRERVSAPFAQALESKIFQKGNAILETCDQPRLKLRELDHPFFEEHIQHADGLRKLKSVQLHTLNDSRQNLVANARLFQERLADLSIEDCERLVKFIYTRTFLVVVSTHEFDSAYRIFTVLNERGLDLTHADILKSEIIGGIPEAEQDEYTRKWETREEDLGRAGFSELFSHIRMVFARTKAKESIIKEFRSTVLTEIPDGKAIIDRVLIPLSDAYATVTRADFKSATDAEEINRLLRWLNRLDNIDWIPPAMSYFGRKTIEPANLLRFLTDLERLAATMFIRRVDVTKRIERYGRVLDAIKKKADLFAPESPLQLDSLEREMTSAKLETDIYLVTKIRLYVLLRLDSVLSSGGATYDHPHITVEHVLPQKPAAGSNWRRWFNDHQRDEWTHRLANLVLLTHAKNASASNFEFDIKKHKYFTRNGVSPFVLTTQVLMEQEWTPEILRTRQKMLVAKLEDLWRLR